jgi:uncharacterized protein (DUF4415 family)
MKKASSSRFTAKQRAELAHLAALSEKRIDTREMPEVRDWSDAKRGLFYRPLKQQLTLRIDRDVVAWFKSHVADGTGYQTSINSALREHVRKRERVARAKR